MLLDQMICNTYACGSSNQFSDIQNYNFQRFAAFLSPLTVGRLTITAEAVYISKVIWIILVGF